MIEYGMYEFDKARVIKMVSNRLNQVYQHLEGATDPSRIDGHVIIVTGGAQGTIRLINIMFQASDNPFNQVLVKQQLSF